MTARTEWRINVRNELFDTPMFDSKLWQIGPAGEQRLPDADSPYPYAAYAYLKPHQRFASAAHAGYSILYIVDGSFTVGDKTFKKGDLRLSEPWSESGPGQAGPEGVHELCVYENGAACIPFFCDKRDPEYRKLREWLDQNEIEFKEPEPPRSGFTGKKISLDLMQDRFRTKWFHSNMFEVGPLGRAGGLPVPDEVRASKRPFFCHAWSDPSLDVPDHMHDGWSFITCIEGSYTYMDGSKLEPGDFLLRSPDYISRNQTRPGPRGMMEICVFQDGKSVTPIIVDPKDPRVADFKKELHL